MDEVERLARLKDLMVLDSASEPVFDSIAQLASQVCGVPIALISLIDVERQWFKANIGLPGVNETPRDVAFCAHAIRGDALFEVPDASRDARFENNPLVTGAPDIRFYAGAPLVLPDGARVGTLCVIDRQPGRLDDAQARMLESLARIATQALVMRRDLITKSLLVRSEFEEALRESEAFLHRTGRVAGVGGWEVDLATGTIIWSEETRRIHEVDADYVPVLDAAINFYAPQARPVIEGAVQEAMRSGKPWDLELPFITAAGRHLWVRAVGEVEFIDGRPVRLIGAFQDITERRLLQQRMADNERFLHLITDSLTVRIAYADSQGRYRFVNRTQCQRFGLPRDQIIGRTRSELTHGSNDAEVLPRLAAVLAGQAQQFELEELVHGQVRRMEFQFVPDMADNGEVRGFFSTGIDITERAASERALQRQTATLHSVMEAIPAMVAVVGTDRRYRLVNSAYERGSGAQRDRIVGHSLAEVMGRVDYDRSRPWIDRALAGESVNYDKEYLEHATPRSQSVSYVPLWLDDGTVDGIVSIAQDITRHKQEEVRLLHLSQRDALTGLLNRSGFEQVLQAHVQQGAGATLALLYVDLDHFKPVNDRHGHPVGDQVLQMFAQRMTKLVRPTDAVARLGGDEFAIVLCGVRASANVQFIAEKVVEAARAPFDVGALRLQIGASVGAAFGVDDAVGWKDLVERADTMLYRAKAEGRGRQAGASP